MKRYKYPRTFHLPWSEGCTDDDKRLSDTTMFEGRHVIVTEKMDGENTTLYPDGHCHARSISSGYHPSRTWVTGWWQTIAYTFPPNLRVCGENVYARHSIPYNDLSSFFLAFSIWDGDTCLSWDETAAICATHRIPLVPILYDGPYNEATIRALHKDGREGYVVRNREAFAGASFSQNVAKWVRPNHVQTDDHWMHTQMVPNQLKDKKI